MNSLRRRPPLRSKDDGSFPELQNGNDKREERAFHRAWESGAPSKRVVAQQRSVETDDDNDLEHGALKESSSSCLSVRGKKKSGSGEMREQEQRLTASFSRRALGVEDPLRRSGSSQKRRPNWRQSLNRLNCASASSHHHRYGDAGLYGTSSCSAAGRDVSFSDLYVPPGMESGSMKLKSVKRGPHQQQQRSHHQHELDDDEETFSVDQTDEVTTSDTSIWNPDSISNHEVSSRNLFDDGSAPHEVHGMFMDKKNQSSNNDGTNLKSLLDGFGNFSSRTDDTADDEDDAEPDWISMPRAASGLDRAMSHSMHVFASQESISWASTPPPPPPPPPQPVSPSTTQDGSIPEEPQPSIAQSHSSASTLMVLLPSSSSSLAAHMAAANPSSGDAGDHGDAHHNRVSHAKVESGSLPLKDEKGMHPNGLPECVDPNNNSRNVFYVDDEQVEASSSGESGPDDESTHPNEPDGDHEDTRIGIRPFQTPAREGDTSDDRQADHDQTPSSRPLASPKQPFVLESDYGLPSETYIAGGLKKDGNPNIPWPEERTTKRSTSAAGVKGTTQPPTKIIQFTKKNRAKPISADSDPPEPPRRPEIDSPDSPPDRRRGRAMSSVDDRLTVSDLDGAPVTRKAHSESGGVDFGRSSTQEELKPGPDMDPDWGPVLERNTQRLLRKLQALNRSKNNVSDDYRGKGCESSNNENDHSCPSSLTGASDAEIEEEEKFFGNVVHYAKKRDDCVEPLNGDHQINHMEPDVPEDYQEPSLLFIKSMDTYLTAASMVAVAPNPIPSTPFPRTPTKSGDLGEERRNSSPRGEAQMSGQKGNTPRRENQTHGSSCLHPPITITTTPRRSATKTVSSHGAGPTTPSRSPSKAKVSPDTPRSISSASRLQHLISKFEEAGKSPSVNTRSIPDAYFNRGGPRNFSLDDRQVYDRSSSGLRPAGDGSVSSQSTLGDILGDILDDAGESTGRSGSTHGFWRSHPQGLPTFTVDCNGAEPLYSGGVEPHLVDTSTSTDAHDEEMESSGNDRDASEKSRRHHSSEACQAVSRQDAYPMPSRISPRRNL